MRLTALPGSQFEMHMAPPQGHWVVCGYGRFGREVTHDLRSEGHEVTIIEPDESADAAGIKVLMPIADRDDEIAGRHLQVDRRQRLGGPAAACGKAHANPLKVKRTHRVSGDRT